MNFDRMRALLLERAIRGELVPQLTEDGSIEQVGNGRGLFDIPKSWGWFEFSKVVKTLSSRGNQIPAKEICERGRFPVVTQSKNSLIDGYSEEESKLVPKAFLPLLVFGDHTRFLKYVDFQFIVGADGTKLIRPKDDGFVNCSYLYYVLRALVPETKDRGYSRHFQFLKKLMIPVPPIHEQCRIVDRVEELLSEINRAEKAYEELQTLAGVLRGQILQEAIQGKLVPQMAEEGVVEQIGAAPDEVPFEIPESWKWCHMKGITQKIHYGFTASAANAGNAKLLRITDIQDGRVNWDTVPFCDVPEKKLASCKLGESDVVIARTGGTIGKSFLLTDVSDVAVFASYLIRLIPCAEVVNPKYLMVFLNSPEYWKQLKAMSQGTGQPNVNAKSLSTLLLPLPPLDEQARIVAKVEELLKHVDALSAK